MKNEGRYNQCKETEGCSYYQHFAALEIDFFFTIIEFYFVFLALSLIHVAILKGSSSRSGISYYQAECSHSANL